MNVLLINPMMGINNLSGVPPLGIYYIYHSLKEEGHSVQILDIDGYRYSKERVYGFVKNTPVDVVGIGGLSTVYPYLFFLVPLIRELHPYAKIVLGGAVASSMKEKCFAKFDIDYEVIGEGEETMVELLREIQTTGNYDSIKGIGYKRNDGEVVFTGNRSLMPALDKVPMFDDSFFPMESYLRNASGFFQVHTQRGCPHGCTFCFNNFRVVSSGVRYRPFEQIVDEIEYFKGKYGNKIKIYALSGECITADKEWIIGFCKEVLRRNLRISYRVTSRVNTIDKEILEWLKKSGCRIMSLGVESGSKKILKIMKKGVHPEKAKSAVSLSRKYIKALEVSIILGYIGEDRDTLRETVEFSKKLGVKPSVFFATAFPGTELYRIALEKGKIKDEEEYLMGLETEHIGILRLNLTDIPDAEAKKALLGAKKEIRNYYYFTRPWLPIIVLINRIKSRGFSQN
ncbi:MAG: B12-binding domain-containing radical SAM protein [Candidatus Scalindua sp.]|jgi:anaerobic magnesium-protoporphyrin IX monomethyl ester cyclase|nr:B12-binding domain-containing radical SAM protein [Candidatus Scalindua sp.]MBT6049147.1 B12-binding domain-containing radical SAM protein [Candidatus Scalindua sp.]MBT6230847.1 B12-binding domain-containing radical SAM protein [Candidatus Scalindua sp.]